jgi:hypothetical protein
MTEESKYIDVRESEKPSPEYERRALDYCFGERKPVSDEVVRARWENIIFHTTELFGAANYVLIAPVLLERLCAYRDDGTPVGSFLQAVLSNNLRDAIGRADEYNRATLFHLVAWMHNEFPGKLWGSPERYAAWIETKRLEREEKELKLPGGHNS